MKDSKEENSYRSIIKGTSLFGSVQLFQILINLVRGKFVAMFLGPEGMGISALFTSSANTIQQISSLGLNLAIVKEISVGKEDGTRLRNIVEVARRLLLLTSLLGVMLCAFFSPFLSRWAFGTEDYKWQFVLLSLMVFFAVSGVGELSILQGLHDVKRLSKASLIGAVTGLFIGVPLYYFFGNKGIVPAMIALSLSMFIFYRISVHRNLEKKDKIIFSWKDNSSLIRKLFLLGMVLMASDLIGTICGYLINTFIRSSGSLDDVGFFQASNSLTNQCIGVVFTAMSLDFFPRLAAIASDNCRMREVVNRQTEIIALIISPILVSLIILSPFVVRLLLTDSFAAIVPLLRWMAFGSVLKALSFPMGYIAFAKDNKRLFFWLEGVMGNLLWLLLSCIFYNSFGLIGLGVSMVLDYGICTVVYYIVNRSLYEYRLSRRTILLSFYAVAVVAATFVISFVFESKVFYIISFSVLAFTLIFSTRKLMKIWRIRQVSDS